MIPIGLKLLNIPISGTFYSVWIGYTSPTFLGVMS
jgi:hypothetical protein